jgi:predicted AlkP superfamily pyrophosphatase or phosphodiesterase
MKRVLVLLFVLAQLARPASGSQAGESPLVVISLDGFRWDYTELYANEAPTLRALMRDGAVARSLIPVFPSNTFPNHYSIVTGLYPAHHGIIDNSFFDPKLGVAFRFNQPNAARESRWWGGEPIWATAIKQGQRAAADFWVGSEAEIAGVRPTFWRPYDPRIPFEQRLDEVVRWLTLPPAERPSFIVFYLEETNGAGHRHGPESREVAEAIKLSDTRVATMLSRLRAEKIEPNVVIVSDHGMTAMSLERVILLEDYVERASVQVDAEGSVMALRPVGGDVGDLLRALEKIAHVRANRAEDLPARLRLAGNDRIAPVWVLPDEGWHILTRPTFERLRTNYRATGYLRGDHGYDPALPNMHGILIGHGPAFRRGVQHPAVENIHVYNLLCAILGLMPAKNDGDDRLAKALLNR